MVGANQAASTHIHTQLNRVYSRYIGTIALPTEWWARIKLHHHTHTHTNTQLNRVYSRYIGTMALLTEWWAQIKLHQHTYTHN